MYEYVGTWWNDKYIDVIKKNGRVYALNGWNGESYTESWEGIGENHLTASDKKYLITPIYEANDSDEEDFIVVDYEIQEVVL